MNPVTSFTDFNHYRLSAKLNEEFIKNTRKLVGELAGGQSVSMQDDFDCQMALFSELKGLTNSIELSKIALEALKECPADMSFTLDRLVVTKTGYLGLILKTDEVFLSAQEYFVTKVEESGRTLSSTTKAEFTPFVRVAKLNEEISFGEINKRFNQLDHKHRNLSGVFKQIRLDKVHGINHLEYVAHFVPPPLNEEK